VRFRRLVYAAHFGISGRISSREAETRCVGRNDSEFPAIKRVTINVRSSTRPATAGATGENGIQAHGSSFFSNRGRIDAVAHAADQTATFGQSGGMASVVRQRPVCSDMTSASR